MNLLRPLSVAVVSLATALPFSPLTVHAATPGPEEALAFWRDAVHARLERFSIADFAHEQVEAILRREALAPFDAGADTAAPWHDEARAYLEEALSRARIGDLADRPNPDWGRAYDFTVRYGCPDPFLRWMSIEGQRRWHWESQARAQLADLEPRVAASDGTAFQRLLAAHARARLDPSRAHAAAFCQRASDWADACRALGDAPEAVDAILAQLFRQTPLDFPDEPPAGSGAAPESAAPLAGSVDAPAVAEHREGPPLHADFATGTFLPLLVREIVAPLEAREEDRDAPWRPEALDALRGWLDGVARGARRPAMPTLARAASAASRGCSWPAIRYLAAWQIFAQQGENPRADGARKMREAVREALSDTATTPLARVALLRHLCFWAGDAQWNAALSEAFAALVGSRSWEGADARVLWWLRRDSPAWADLDLTERLWPEDAPATWLRETMRGERALALAWGLRGEDYAVGAARTLGGTFRGYMDEATRRFRAAAAMEPSFPEAPWQLVRCLRGSPGAREWLDETVRREFDCPGVREAYLFGLRPRWGGSVAAMTAFGDECLATGRFDTQVPLVWAKARFAAASELGRDWEEAFRGDEAVGSAKRLCDAILSDPGATDAEKADASWMLSWPLYVNNRFNEMEDALDRMAKQVGHDGYRPGLNFDEGHFLHHHWFGWLYGIDGAHTGEIHAALRCWRVDHDPEAARDILADPEMDEHTHRWTQSWVAGRLAVLNAEISARTGEWYSLLPGPGCRCGHSLFWRNWNHDCQLVDGAWRIRGPRQSELQAIEGVLPANALLDLSVRPAPERPADRMRFAFLPDADGFDLSLSPALLLERREGAWSLGWCRLAADVRHDDRVEDLGERVGVVPDEDGSFHLRVRLTAGSAKVFVDGEERTALRRKGEFRTDGAHAIGFAGRDFELFVARARGLRRKP